MESYVEQGAGADSIEQIGFGGARRTKKKHRGLTVFQLKVIGAVALALSAGSTTIVPLFFGSDVDGLKRGRILVCYSDLRVAAGAGFP